MNQNREPSSASRTFSFLTILPQCESRTPLRLGKQNPRIRQISWVRRPHHQKPWARREKTIIDNENWGRNKREQVSAQKTMVGSTTQNAPQKGEPIYQFEANNNACWEPNQGRISQLFEAGRPGPTTAERRQPQQQRYCLKNWWSNYIDRKWVAVSWTCDPLSSFYVVFLSYSIINNTINCSTNFTVLSFVRLTDLFY